MKRFAIVAAVGLLALSACATGPRTPPEPIVRTVEVKVPVVAPCPALATLGAAPAYPDTEAALTAAPNLFERVKLLLAGRVLRVQRELALTAAVGACQF